MAMKPIKLLASLGHGLKASLNFKWQYKISYEIYVGNGVWGQSVQDM